MTLRRECGHRRDPAPEHPDALFFRILIATIVAFSGVGWAVFWWPSW